MESGTVEQALPGLGHHAVTSPAASASVIGLTPAKRLTLVSGRSNPVLATRIAEQLGCELGTTTLKTFANGETYCRYEESIRGADVFIVQTAALPVDQNLMELLIMVNAAKLASAKRITAVIPWYFYVRQDKKSRPREPITAKLVADLLQTAGVDRVLTMDLHAGQVQGFFEIPVDHMTAVPMFAQYVRDLGLDAPLAAVSPDTGRAKLAGKFGEMIGGDLVILNKVRPGHNVARVTTVIGDVEGKIAVMSDDVVDTGGTLVAGAASAEGGGCPQGLRLRDARALQRPGAGADRRERDRQARGDRHRAGRPADEARQRRGAVGRRDPGGDDPECLLRRLGLGDLRRREPALLAARGRRGPSIELAASGSLRTLAEMDRTVLWRRVADDAEQLKRFTPEGHQVVVEVFLAGRESPLMLGHVETRRGEAESWIRFQTVDDVWVHADERHVQRVELRFSRSTESVVGFRHRELPDTNGEPAAD